MMRTTSSLICLQHLSISLYSNAIVLDITAVRSFQRWDLREGLLSLIQIYTAIGATGSVFEDLNGHGAGKAVFACGRTVFDIH